MKKEGRLPGLLFFAAAVLLWWGCGSDGAAAFFEEVSANVTALPFSATFGAGDFHYSTAFAYKCFQAAAYSNLLVRVSDVAGIVRVVVRSNSAVCAVIGVYRPNSADGAAECVATSFVCPAQGNFGEVVFLAQRSIAYYFYVSTSTMYCDVNVSISTVAMAETGAETLTISKSLEWGHTGNFDTEPHSPLLAFGTEVANLSSIYQKSVVPQGKLLEVHANVSGVVEVAMTRTDPNGSDFLAYLVVTTPNAAAVLKTDVTSHRFNVSTEDVFYVLATCTAKYNPIVEAPSANFSYALTFSFHSDDSISPAAESSSDSNDGSSFSSCSSSVADSPSSSSFLDKISSSGARPLSSSFEANSALEEPSSSSSIKQRRTGLSLLEIIYIAIALVATVVLGTAFALFVSSVRSRRRSLKVAGVNQDPELDRITFHTVPEAGAIISIAEAATTAAAATPEELSSTIDTHPLESLPIRSSVSELTFGLQGEQAPVGIEITDRIEMRNASDSKQRFTFSFPQSPKWRFEATPNTAVVKSGKTVSVDVKLLFLCTTQLREYLSFTVEGAEDETQKPLRGIIGVFLVSKTSTLIDNDEVTRYDPSLGGGSYGTVYKGSWHGTEVAVKVLNQAAIDQNKSVLEDFMHETETLRGIRSDFIVAFFGAVLVPQNYSLVTEFCPLGNLSSLMKKHPRISFALRLRFGIDCARGMLFLHSNGTLHRNLKPNNVLVVATNAMAPVVCKLTDFVSTQKMFARAREDTSGIGAPWRYTAPEVLLGAPYSAGADMYSYAILLYELYTRRNPFSGPEFASANDIAKFVCHGKRPPIPSEWPLQYANTVVSCWAENLADRPASFRDVLRNLEQLFEVTSKNRRANFKLQQFQGNDKGDDDGASTSAAAAAAAGDGNLDGDDFEDDLDSVDNPPAPAPAPAPAPVAETAARSTSDEERRPHKSRNRKIRRSHSSKKSPHGQ